MLWIKAKTAWRLGMPSLYRYFVYHIGVKTGLNPVRRLAILPPEGPFFYQPATTYPHLLTTTHWMGEASYFGWFREPLPGGPPIWHRNPFTEAVVSAPQRPWWQIPNFDPELGDIKTIWELSRFDWVLAFALQARSGGHKAIDQLNEWLTDWLAHNPPYCGPNWKCGQEASIRVMHLAMAAFLLTQWENPTPGLLALVRLHLARIAPTVYYALAQDNNHGTSEAAALFIGGSWLCRHYPGDREAEVWRQSGRHWLEERTTRLIQEDGSFSQYSVNYHRLLLDTLSMVTLWQQQMGETAFSARFYERCRLATQWLYAFVNPSTGDAPNLGANDGARLLPFPETDYRDFRPSVQLAAALFCQKLAYPVRPGQATHGQDVLQIFGMAAPAEQLSQPASRLYDEGGYALLVQGNARSYIRYPRYRFRPSHADGLHLDFWLNERNILRDGGSYSYAAEAAWQGYFGEVASHNTVQFDGRDQMPRLGRFLYGAWLETRERRLFDGEEGGRCFSASYRDWQGALHQRQVCLEAHRLQVIDRISGFQKAAVLRWRLCPGVWQPVPGGWQCGELSIQIAAADMPIVRMEIVEGWESRYYLQRTALPVIEVEVDQPGAIYTDFLWSNG